MSDKAVYEDPFLIVYCPDNYIIQKMCNEAVDDSVAVLKLIPDWFVSSKMIKKLLTTLYGDKNIYSTLVKVLVMPYLIVMEWAFLI